MKKIFLDALCVTYFSFGFSCYADSPQRSELVPTALFFQILLTTPTRARWPIR